MPAKKHTHKWFFLSEESADFGGRVYVDILRRTTVKYENAFKIICLCGAFKYVKQYEIKENQ